LFLAALPEMPCPVGRQIRSKPPSTPKEDTPGYVHQPWAVKFDTKNWTKAKLPHNESAGQISNVARQPAIGPHQPKPAR